MIRIIKFILYAINPTESFIAYILLLSVLLVLLPVQFKILRDAVYYSVMLGLLGYISSKHIDTRAQRYSAIVILEAQMLAVVDTIDVNVKKLRRALDQGEPLAFQDPVPFQLPFELTDDLGRLILKRAAVDTIIDLKLLNGDFIHTAELIRQNMAYLLKRDPDHVKAALRAIEALKQNAENVFLKAVNCLSMAKFFINTDKPLFRAHQPFYVKEDLEASTKKEIEGAKKKLADARKDMLS
jgi:hypothetical protein